MAAEMGDDVASETDSTASDSKGSNSPFTEARLSHIEKPGFSVSDMIIAVPSNGSQSFAHACKQPAQFRDSHPTMFD